MDAFAGGAELDDGLVLEGLVGCEPAPEDRRGSYVVITATGSAVLRKMWPVYERALDDAFAARLRSPRALKRALVPLGD